jgi:integrase
VPRLTQTMLDRATAPAGGQRFLRDAKVQGLALRISRGGAKAWVWEGRVRGRVRRITLGHHPAFSLARARRKALAMAAAVADGKDPAAERARERGELTFGAFAQTYLERHAAPHKRSVDEDKRMLRDVLPQKKEEDKEREPAPIPATWKHRRLSDITRGEVTQLHGHLQRDRGLYTANRVLALLRTMFNLAKRWGTLIADNPAAGVRMFREEKRDRFLNPDELKRALAAIEQEADWRWKAYFKLSLLLGPRRSELLSARWVDIDLQTCTWRLPTTKAGRSHLLPLPTPAVAILESLPSRGQFDWLFPSTTAASGHLEEPKKAWRRIRSEADVKDVRVHDLRRTLGSWLAASSYGLPLIGRVLNHSQPSATAIYARLDLEPVRAALEANAQAMLGVVTASKGENRRLARPGAGRMARPVPGPRTLKS